MFMCAHVYDVALNGNTVRNVARGLRLAGHSCLKSFEMALPENTVSIILHTFQFRDQF